MATIRISADEAARDFASLLARVRAGAEVVIDDDASPSVVMRAAAAPYDRSISESIALAEAHAREAGSEPMMDADFAADVEEVIRMRKPRDTSAWD